MTVDFPHRLAGHCGSGALRDLLEHRGLDFGDGPLSEGMVFGLAGGLGCFYVEAGDVRYLVGRTGELERDVAPVLGAGLDVRETDDPAEGWAWVREAVDAGRPPMVWADIARLEYLRVRMVNTRHDIVVAGYDDTHAWIADNDREELQRCSLESLASARHSDGFPGPNRHRVYLYDWPDALPDRTTAARRGIARAVANMREDPPGVGDVPGLSGLEAIDAFAAAYASWDDLNLLWALIVKAGTGGAFFRSLHATFLRESGFADAADHYDDLAAAWVQLAARAREGTRDQALVDRIRDAEHAGVAAMEALR